MGTAQFPDAFSLDPSTVGKALTNLVLGGRAPASVDVELLDGGHSNLTYRVRVDGTELILRRGPLGPLAATANDMGREHRLLSALADSGLPTPRPLAYCADPSVIGAPFLVMEHLAGTIVRTLDDARQLGAVGARLASEALISTLAQIHSLDVPGTQLADIGRGEGFLARQLQRWNDRRTQLKERPADLDRLGELLARVRLPETPRASLVHGDYRIDNLVLDPSDPGTVRGILDWEMSTIGDPLADVGLLLLYWGEESDAFISPEYRVTTAPGFMTRAEVLEAYANHSGACLDHIAFYVLLAHLKLAVIAQGIVDRFRRGETPGDRFAHVVPIPERLARRALDLTGQ